MHWAFELIGRPWTPEDDCWALIRYVFRTRHEVEMPAYAGDAFALTEAARAAGWRPVDGIGEVDDVVLMRTIKKNRHVGVLIHANGKIGVLHADGHMTEAGPVGAVSFDTLHKLSQSGCTDFQFWRRG